MIRVAFPAGFQFPVRLKFLDFLVAHPSRAMQGTLFARDLSVLRTLLAPPAPPSPPAATVQSFRDVTPSFWAYGAIRELAALGVVDGLPDGSFRPEAPVTRSWSRCCWWPKGPVRPPASPLPRRPGRKLVRTLARSRLAEEAPPRCERARPARAAGGGACGEPAALPRQRRDRPLGLGGRGGGHQARAAARLPRRELPSPGEPHPGRSGRSGAAADGGAELRERIRRRKPIPA